MTENEATLAMWLFVKLLSAFTYQMKKKAFLYFTILIKDVDFCRYCTMLYLKATKECTMYKTNMYST